MSLVVLDHNKGGRQVKPRNRASLACLRCRIRKVRCDVSQNGQPCMNCHLDEESCEVTKRSKKWPWRARSQQLRNRIHGSELESVQEQQQEQSYNRTKSKGGHQSIIGHIQNEKTSDETAAGQSGASPVRQDNTWSMYDTPGESCGRLDHDTTLPHSSSPCLPNQSAMVVYHTYPFVSRLNLFHTAVQDIQHLESEGCFQLPIPEILDQFVRQYFLHVQPMLPMLSEMEFWDAFTQPSPPESKTSSLLLVQSMLFAACSTVPSRAFNRLGYSSARSARAAFYRKAKLLYDVGIEPSAMATARAALLLTFWNPPLRADLKPNTMWLMIAIENAKSAHADRHSDLSSGLLGDVGQSVQLRRLWWCCIIRDRILPLGLRRSPQITQAHFDIEKNMEVGFMDLQTEILRSKLHGETTKEFLAAVIEHVVKLSVVLTNVLLLAFPLKDSNNASQYSQSQIRHCKAALSAWYEELPFQSWNTAVIKADPTAILHKTVMEIYYHWANVVTCHLTIRSVGVAHPEAAGQLSLISEARQEAQRSTIDIVESLQLLNQLGLTERLPITIAAYVAFPLAIHVFEATCSDLHIAKSCGDTEKSLFMTRLSTLVKAMKALHAQYDGVEEVVRTIRRIVDYVNLNATINKPSDIEHHINQQLSSNMDIRVSLAIDWSLSSGRPADGEEFATYLGGMFHPSPTTSSSEAQTTPVDMQDMHEISTEDGPCNVMATTSYQEETDWTAAALPPMARNTMPTWSNLFVPLQQYCLERMEEDEAVDAEDHNKDAEIEKMIEQILHDPSGGQFNDFFLAT